MMELGNVVAGLVPLGLKGIQTKRMHIEYSCKKIAHEEGDGIKHIAFSHVYCVLFGICYVKYRVYYVSYRIRPASVIVWKWERKRYNV